MATETNSGGGSGWLAFIVGALIVVVALLGYMMWSGNAPKTASNGLDVTVHAPNLPKLPAPEVPTAPAPSTPTP